MQKLNSSSWLRRVVIPVLVPLLSGAAVLSGAMMLGAAAAVAQTAPMRSAEVSGAAVAGKQTTGSKNSGANKDAAGGSQASGPKVGEKSATKPASAGEQAASPQQLKLGPLDPNVKPPDLPKNRPVIGLALGGGGALAMSDIGVLEWFDEHHIPVDVIAGTSMGCIIASLYTTGHTTEAMTHIMTDSNVASVFRIQSAYTARNFRRREDSREIPNAITLGLKHGPSVRNSLYSDTGLNELLDKEFLRYNDQIDFNDLPVPLRCQATDLNAAKTVTFSRGSLQDAVRASASIPGVFRPFQLNGHEFVDGAILENLPTPDVKAMGADVVLAVSLPLAPAGKNELDSILGVLQRTFAVGIEVNEARDRKLANVVIMPDIKGYTESDYLKTPAIAQLGYAAAEADKAELMKYAVSDAEWEQYMEQRMARERGPVGPVLQVKVSAPNAAVRAAVERKFAPLVNKPVNTGEIQTLLAEVRSDGRYDADYTVGYDSEQSRRAILLVTVNDKKNGPPFLDVGLNLAAQTAGVTRATVNTILLYQDLGGYGSEFRAKLDFGFQTLLEGEYYRKLTWSGFFAAPRADLNREPFYIYQGNYRAAERQLQTAGVGGDIGWSDGKQQELRAGWDFHNVHWTATTGSDGQPNYNGNSQTARVRYVYDSQDRDLVPLYGIRSVTSLGYLYATPGSPSAPQLASKIEFAHSFRFKKSGAAKDGAEKSEAANVGSAKNVFLINAEGATMFNRDVAQPFRYTLGGPLRLSASAIDQYRGTDYFLVTPGYLRRVAQLPQPLGTSLYVGGAYEVGQMRAPDAATITRQDVYFGLIAETPLGAITFAPSIGDGGERKFTFTIGKLF